MRIDSCEHLHKSRLARPVLSNQGMNLALMKIEGNSIECANTGKGLRNVAHLEEGRLIRSRHLVVWMVYGLWALPTSVFYGFGHLSGGTLAQILSKVWYPSLTTVLTILFLSTAMGSSKMEGTF